MWNSIFDLHQQVKSGTIVNAKMFEHFVLTTLENRYKSDFESEWERNFKALSHLSMEKGIPGNRLIFHQEIKDLAYLSTYKATGEDEVAGLVADDMDMIALAIILEYQDPWLSKLAKAYEQNCFPTSV